MVGAVTVQIEPFDAPDSIALRAALTAELYERFGADTEPGVKPTVADIEVFVVARRDGTPVGCGGLRRLDAATLEVKRMYVAPAARRLGIARRLLECLETHARALGANRIVLETGDELPDAIGFYERAGYRPIPCFGAYAGAPRSRCYARMLPTTT